MNFDLAGLVEIIGGFAIGSLAGSLHHSGKNPAEAGNRGYLLRIYGRAAEFPAQLCVCAASVIMYHQKKSKRTAIIGMAISSVFTGIVAILPTYISSFPSIWH